MSTPTSNCGFDVPDNVCRDCGKSLSDCDCAGAR